MFHYLSTAINVSSKGRIFLKYSSFCQTIRRAKKYRRRATISHASRPSYYFRGIRNSGRECLEYFIRFNPFIRRIPIFIESSFPIFTSLSLNSSIFNGSRRGIRSKHTHPFPKINLTYSIRTKNRSIRENWIEDLNADRNSAKLSIKIPGNCLECLESNYSQLPLNTWPH